MVLLHIARRQMIQVITSSDYRFLTLTPLHGTMAHSQLQADNQVAHQTCVHEVTTVAKVKPTMSTSKFSIGGHVVDSGDAIAMICNYQIFNKIFIRFHQSVLGQKLLEYTKLLNYLFGRHWWHANKHLPKLVPSLIFDLQHSVAAFVNVDETTRYTSALLINITHSEDALAQAIATADAIIMNLYLSISLR